MIALLAGKFFFWCLFQLLLLLAILAVSENSMIFDQNSNES